MIISNIPIIFFDNLKEMDSFTVLL
jgi:hypothetical protein